MNSKSDSHIPNRAKYERLVITRADFAEARRFGQEFLNSEMHGIDKSFDITARAFTNSIVTSYSRPFTQRRDREGSREGFDLDFLLEGLDPEAQGLHKSLLQRRDQCFAHSDASVRSVRITEVGDQRQFSSWDVLLPLERREVEKLLKMIEVMTNELDKRIAALEDSVPSDNARSDD